MAFCLVIREFSRLGSALVRLGEREHRLDLICEALSLHAVAWEIFSGGAPAYTSAAMDRIRLTIQSMRKRFEIQKVAECLRQHDKVLQPLLSELGGN